MVNHQKQSRNRRTVRDKEHRYLLSNKLLKCTTAFAVTAVLVGGGTHVVRQVADLQQRHIQVSGGVYSVAVMAEAEFQNGIKENRDQILSMNARNSIVADYIAKADQEEEVSNMEVASGLPNLSFDGYSGAKAINVVTPEEKYGSEISTDTIVNGIENLTKKYEAYTSYGGSSTDLTPDVLYQLQVSCEEWGLDPYFMLGVIMTESKGNANAKSSSSTATGLCQILKGTGKSVYEDLLGNGKGTYNHSMAYDPVLNVKMGCAYMGSLKSKYGLYRAIQAYRGKKDISGYCASINRYMALSGHSLDFK